MTTLYRCDVCFDLIDPVEGDERHEMTVKVEDSSTSDVASMASRLDSGDSIDRQTVIMHAHDSPCGLIDVDDSVTMPAEAVVSGVADLGVSVRRCSYCGEAL